MPIEWSPSTVEFVRTIKNFFGLFSGTTVCGIPLDWPLRFVILASLCLVFARWLQRRTAVAVCLLILAGSESLEIVASRTPGKLYWPNAGDAADLAAGLLGIIAGGFARSWLASSREPLNALPPQRSSRDFNE